MAHEDELAALAATPAILRSLLEDGRESRPAGDEDWTAGEVVAHLRDCEEFRLLRCSRMRDEDEPVIAAFDQEALARERNYASVNLGVALAEFQDRRERVLRLLSALDEAQWQRTGLHEEDGLVTIESHVRHAISYDLVHLRQIAESLRPLAARG